MLECSDISIRAGKKFLFKLTSLDLQSGLYALVGRNGTGKSTLLSTLLGEIMLETGTIKIGGVPIDQLSSAELASKVSIVRSRPMVYGDYKAVDILMLGRLPYQGLLAFASVKDKAIVQEVVEMLQMQAFARQEYNSLSDGEKQLVMVGRAIVQDTPIILLDEPTAFLDLVNRQELFKHLKKLAQEKGKLVIFSTHHIELTAKFCDGILLINNEELNLHLNPNEFVARINQAFGINNEI